MDSETESLEEARLKSFIKELKVEYGILDKLVYKNKNQHRRSSYFQYLVKVRRDLRLLLQSADLEHILNSSFLVIHGKRPKQKVQLLESLKRRKCDGNHSFLDRLLGIARLLSQIIEPMVKAAMEISALIARSFFMGFSLAIMGLLARLRVLVQQILLDVVSVFNAVSSLSRKEQSVKLTQVGLEVYRDLFPTREQAVYLDCVWKTDKFVLFENISERVDTNQDEILMDVYPGGASTVQYQCIETLLGDTDEPVTVDQSFTCEQGSSDIKGNNLCFLEGSTDRTNDGKLVRDGRERQCFADICSEKRLSEGAFLKDKSESRNKVAFVSIKMPITSAQDAVIPVKDIESCSGNTEDPAFLLIADGNLKESLL
ncbi:Cytosolic carboxypeptidase [Heracleum sosnowskyi]|uniref:Cytosolic carboxypeptidase n=1 Tax=Heracleum sosnowskyi TaxID=360622 RepID=A0AAD8IST5_9APIA|nr:Cytosolic carboxypeptidase [Heracleum sosnowskyi]